MILILIKNQLQIRRQHTTHTFFRHITIKVIKQKSTNPPPQIHTRAKEQPPLSDHETSAVTESHTHTHTHTHIFRKNFGKSRKKARKNNRISTRRYSKDERERDDGWVYVRNNKKKSSTEWWFSARNQVLFLTIRRKEKKIHV
jgi:hypothetical protein